MLINFLRLLLLPFSYLYGFIIECHNWLYDFGFKKSIKFPIPIISIGNITAGGTGKTPFTIYLAELLKKDYPKIAIISRGYGRQSKGMQIVSNGENIILNPVKSGDEPFLIASRLPSVIVIVSEKRNIAIDYLQKEHQPDLILLDDAFQHRQTQRDVNIVLMNFDESYLSKLMLPSGILREFRHNLKRADIILQTNVKSSAKQVQNNLTKYTVNIYNCKSVISTLIDIDLNDAGTLEILKSKPIIAFAGIAYPDNVKNALIGQGILIRNFQSYSDHYNFKNSDIENLINLCKAEKCQNIVCTEKDIVKITHSVLLKKQLQNSGIELYAIRLKLVIEKPDQLVKNIKTLLDKNV